LVTSLVPVIGYDKAAELAHRAHSENLSIKDVVIEQRLFTSKEIKDLLDPMKLTGANR
jgi:fumarate hydratase class II